MKAIAGGRFCLIGSGDAFANYVYVEDVVESCVHLTQDDEAVGEVYHIADPATMKGFVGRAAELLGVRMPAGVPEWAAYALAIAAEGIGRVGRFTPPLTVNRVRALTSRVVFGGDKLARSLVLPVGWREGLRRTILAYRQMELLP
jgi:nucleoside-diphosphate-sugar epimerase